MACLASLLFTLVLFVPQQDKVADALRALDAHQPSVAESLLRQAIQADPKDFAAHFNLGLALTALHEDTQAIDEYRKTLELKPGLYQADLNLGMLLVRGKRFSEALPILKEASEAKPKELRPNLYYGQALLETGDAATAEARFRLASEIDPKNAVVQYSLGRALAKQGKLHEASAQYKLAAELDPAYKGALLEIASQFETAEPDQAIAIYQQFPENATAQERLGELLIESKDFAAAIPKLERAVETAPTPQNRFALGTAYKRNKQIEKAAVEFGLAVQSDPKNYDLRMTFGRELRDLRKFVPAAQQFAAAANLKPDSVEAWNELASVLIVGESYEQGLAALDRVKVLGKETPGNYYLRAITLDKLKQRKPALQSYQQFLAADNGKLQDEEFKARQRIRIIQHELEKR